MASMYILLAAVWFTLLGNGFCGSQRGNPSSNSSRSLSSFQSILHHVTRAKLDELNRQKVLMNSHFQPILDQIAKLNQQSKSKEALTILLTGLVDSPIKDVFSYLDIEHVKTLLANSDQDTSISPALMSAWVEKFRKEIGYSLRKCDYSYLYGTLLREWLEVTTKEQAGAVEGEPVTSDNSGGDHDSNPTTASQIENFKKLLFSTPTFDAVEFQRLLESLFRFGDDVKQTRTFAEFQRLTKDEFDITTHQIATHELVYCIKGLIAGNLLSQDKKNTLRELAVNGDALNEVSSLLTSTLRNLDRWKWNTFSTTETALLTRGLAGVYKVQIDEDVLTALFLQYVGVRWAAYFKRQFTGLYNDHVWKTEPGSIYGSIATHRKDFHRSAFLSKLPSSMEEQENAGMEEYVKITNDKSESSDDYYADEMEFGAQNQVASSRVSGFSQARPAAGARPQKLMFKSKMQHFPTTYRPPVPQLPEVDFKQKFLHVLSTEIRLCQVLCPNSTLTVVQTEFESFGSTIYHEPILATLTYFGVSQTWLSFFSKFLKPRIKFHGDSGEARKVLRGVPTDHVLSDVFAETLLFLLDFSVTSQVDSTYLYRISDEFWYWHRDSAEANRAWETIKVYSKFLGVKSNKNRSGSVAVACQSPSEVDQEIVHGAKPLPQRGIRWGYLNLHSDGTFKIDEKATEKFVTEMTTFLSKSSTVLQWIRAYNKYMPFFIRNFGKSALVLGIKHQDEVLGSLKKIHSSLFNSEGNQLGNPISSLKVKFVELADLDVIDAWVYWPLDKGGLGLVNPFIPVMLLREAYDLRNDTSLFQELPLLDKLEYDRLKKQYEENLKNPPPPISLRKEGRYVVEEYVPKPFQTWEEYVGKRESGLIYWGDRYTALQEILQPIRPPVSFGYTLGTHEDGNDEDYLVTLFNYYQPQLVKHFGTVEFINSQLLPKSLIKNILKSNLKY